MVKILVFGDSITWGAFDFENGGWVERLKIKYFKEFDDTGISVYNLGISSNDTRSVLAQVENQIKNFHIIEPEKYILLFSIGSNDCRYLNTAGNYFVPEKEFKENLYKIILTSKKYGSRIIFTGLMGVDEDKTMPIPWEPTEFYKNSDIVKYDKIIEEICQENDLDFIPLIDTINDEDLSDGVHPNTNGHEKNIFKS